VQGQSSLPATTVIGSSSSVGTSSSIGIASVQASSQRHIIVQSEDGAPCIVHAAAGDSISFNWLLFWLGVLVGVLCTLCIRLRQTKSTKKNRTGRTQKGSGRTRIAGLLIFFFIVSLLPHLSESVQAETTSPLKFVYNGHLLNSAGTAITTEHTVRFSYWKSTDYTGTDTSGDGSINTGAANYASWQEVHTFTPDANGYFSLQLGSVTALSDFSSYTAAELQSLFLQVEVKVSSAADTSYELLDTNPSSTSIDRSPIVSVPFALNADKLDRHDVGTGSGSIPLLGSGGLLPVSTVPSGTNQNTFTIDADDTATGSVVLRFGTLLQKTLTYDKVNTRFTFNESVRVQGNLTVTGLINGVDIQNLSDTTATQLKVSSGAGLTISIAGGGYRLNSTNTVYAGGTGIAVANNVTNYVFFGSGGLTVRSSGYPTDESYIPLAVVVTSGGSITSVTDNRVMQADDREEQIQTTYHPEYPDASYSADGSSNVGQLSVASDAVTLKSSYTWTSTRTTLQDYDVVLRITLPTQFVRWKASPISFLYKSSSADTSVSKMDVTVYDTAGNTVTLSGTSTNLANTSWTTQALDFSGSPVWTPGETVVMRFSLSAKDTAQMMLGDLTLKYVKLSGN
jgi:hypothetical protein